MSSQLQESLRIMSFNLRYNLEENEGVARVDALVTEINAYAPDVLGVQEDTPEWSDYLDSKLKGYTAHRGDVSMLKPVDERVALFYRTEKFCKLDEGSKWLSNTPDVRSRFLESGTKRKMNYVVLERKSDGARFCYANTHLENGGVETPIYQERETARIKQIKVLLGILNEIGKAYHAIPVIITGDFNVTASSSVYSTVLEHGFWDARLAADETTDHWTFNHGYADHSRFGEPAAILDFCFVTQNRFRVLKYQVPTEQYLGMYPSDHFPIVVDVLFS